MEMASLRKIILENIEVPESEFEDDGNLIDYGLDSMKVFDIISMLQDEGIQIEITDLAQEPTLSAWWTLISEKSGASS